MSSIVPEMNIISSINERNIDNLSQTEIPTKKILYEKKNNIIEPIKYSASTSDSIKNINPNILTNSSEEEGKINYSTEEYLKIHIIDNSKPVFLTDLKPVNKKIINNSLQKEKLEMIYKDKLNYSLISDKEDYYIDDINYSLLKTQKKEDEYNKLLNVKIEKNSEKEEMKMLYKTQSEQIIYDKSFGYFYGFFATTFKNRKKENLNKLQIHINLNDDINNKKYNFFGIYEGHKNVNISTYLKENLSKSIFQEMKELIINPIKRIKNCFINTDKKIINECSKNKEKDIYYEKGGSCAHILINYDNKLYIGNCGNSRSIISSNYGELINNLSIDHTPNEENERKRIEDNNGKLIQKKNIFYIQSINFPFSRSIGDFEIKNNNKNILISEPDVIEIEINNNMDFIVMGSQEIFQYINNEDLCMSIFSFINQGIIINLDYKNILLYCSNSIIEYVIDKGAKDNLSIIVLFMKNIYNLILNKDCRTIEKILNNFKVKTDFCDSLFVPNKFFGFNIFEKNKSNDIQNNNAINKKENRIYNTNKKKAFLKCLCFK